MPLISSVTSFVKIFQLALYGEKNCFFKNRHYTSLNKGNLLRYVVLTIPVFGNVVVGIYDLKKTSQYLLTLKTVTIDGLALEFASKENQNCLQIVKAAIAQNEKAFKFAAKSFRNNLNFIEENMTNISLFRYAADELKLNQELALKMMKVYGIDVLQYFMEDLLNDENFMERAMEISVSALKFSKTLRKSKDFVSKMNQRFERVLKFSSIELRKDLNFVESLTKARMSCLEDADEEVRSNIAFIKKCMTIDLQALEFSNIINKENFMVSFLNGNFTFIERLPSRYKSDKQFLKQFKQDNFKVICYAENTLRNDLNYHIECIDIGLSLRWAINPLKKNEDLVFAFVKKGKVKELEFADEELLKNEKFANKCILENTESFKFFDQTLRHNRKWILELIKEDEKILSLAPCEFQNDKEFVLKAIEKNKKIMKVCLFRTDEIFVMDAIRIDPSSFQDVNDFFRKNSAFIQKAILIHPSVIKYAACEEILNNAEFFKKVLPFDVSIFEHAGNILRENLDFIKDYIFKDSRFTDSFFANKSYLNVAQNAEILKYSKNSVRDNTELLFSLVDYGVNPFVYASKAAMKDHTFILNVLTKEKSYFKDLNDEMKCLDKVAIVILQHNLAYYDFFPKKAWDKQRIVQVLDNALTYLTNEEIISMGLDDEFLNRIKKEHAIRMKTFSATRSVLTRQEKRKLRRH